jgi:hypothetical protein
MGTYQHLIILWAVIKEVTTQNSKHFPFPNPVYGITIL